MGSQDGGVEPPAIGGWARALADLHRRIGRRFARSEARERVKRYLLGLLGRAERKNGWQLAEALDNVRGIEGKTVIDATNLIGTDSPAGYASNAQFVKSKTNGPTAKSFNINFAALYERIGEAGSTPSNLWCGDEEAREVVEQLNRDAGYEPVYSGPLENAAVQENFLTLMFGINQAGMGSFFYRIAPPDQL